MKRTLHIFSGLAAAFGCGVLLSILIPSDWMLIVTLLVLILLAVCGANLIRG